MIPLEKLKSSPHFTTKELQQWDILFHEGDTDNHLSIVYDGEISVEKSIITAPDTYKVLANLWVGNVIGESSLIRSTPREVRVVAKRNTTLLQIEWGEKFKEFIKEQPDIGYDLMTSIINIANTRLLRANHEITANHEISMAISHIQGSSIASIFKLLHICKKILWVDEILFFERNIAIKEYCKLRFHSEQADNIQNPIVKFPDGKFSLETLDEFDIKTAHFTRNIELVLWDTSYGYLCVGKQHQDFSENEEKLLENTAVSFVGIIHQKRVYENERNKRYTQDL